MIYLPKNSNLVIFQSYVLKKPEAGNPRVNPQLFSLNTSRISII